MGKRGLSTLLDLHQEVIDHGDGYWAKIEVWEAKVSDAVPRGI